ncbi:hypothetical protein SDRG_03762 [Saprolegnia diclina VS20]|uniref:Apple domain-containing protein n=1 Tax=Saprolegnia diclina (strain VS20) TaxID=1156394 RepID=T0S1C6_SAPDV|nr:hypothetical protein SDRG_03762 [Saprolegnia diclina VS20]EQC38803.1 hypothetical protein SDRG_03762 [Saprolegnia diclina VS20]|eukprot:XP_008607627.1 hypothetical protein SDRG_03762 [Saprolegnia diclina VS20]
MKTLTLLLPLVLAQLMLAAPPTCLYETGLDYAGFDLMDVAEMSPFYCCTWCTLVPGCKAFVWTRESERCWLKTEKGKATPHLYAFSGLVSATRCSAIKDDIDISPGADIGSAPSTYPEACCDLCARRASCSAFSWIPWMGGHCSFKSANMSGEAPAPGVRSAFLLP